MPRKARVDAPGALHHIIARGIERRIDKEVIYVWLEKAKGLRDIISHHYFDLNAEAIYNICQENIDELAQTIKMMIKDLS